MQPSSRRCHSPCIRLRRQGSRHRPAAADARFVGLPRAVQSMHRRSLLKRLLGFKNTAIILGVAFLLSGVIRLAVRGTMDADIIVGAVFLAFGIVIALAGKGSSE